MRFLYAVRSFVVFAITITMVAACDGPAYRVDAFTPRVRANPGEADSSFNAGLAYFFLGHREDALNALDRAVELDPGDGRARFIRGLLYAETGNTGAARQDFDLAFASGDTVGASREQLAVAARVRGDYEHEVELLTAAVNGNDPHPLLLRYRLSLACLRSGREETAVAILRRMIGSNPQTAADYGALFILGTILLQGGDEDEAIGLFEQQISLNPGYVQIAEVNLNLGIAYVRTGQYRNAIECFRRVVELQPGNADAYYNLATSYWNDGQRDEALEVAAGLRALSPVHADALDAFLAAQPR